MALSAKEAKARLARAKPLIEENKKKEQQIALDDQREIAMLLQRKETSYRDMPLDETDDPKNPQGPTIRIRWGLTASQINQMAEWLAESEKLLLMGQDEEAAELNFKVIELATFSPEITVEWLRMHQDDVSINDMKRVIQLAYGAYLEQLVRAKQAATFRNKP